MLNSKRALSDTKGALSSRSNRHLANAGNVKEGIVQGTHQSVTISGSNEGTNRKHLPALDGVRGIAVSLVLLRHLFVRNPFANDSFAVSVVTRLLATGWVGVDLFFVLSGFLITGILYDTQQTSHFFRNFYMRRILRIFPLYYGVLAILAIVSISLGYHWFLPGTLRIITYTGTLFLHGIGSNNAPWINLNHLWSLQIEEQFYCVWPFLVSRLQTKRRILAACAIGIFLSFCVRIVAVLSGLWSSYPYTLYSWTPGRFDGLLSGAALAILVRTELREWLLRSAGVFFWTLTTICVASIFCVYIYSPTQNPLVGIVGPILYASISASLLLMALRRGSRTEHALSSSWLRFMGRLSYGLYIFHWIIYAMLVDKLHAIVAAHSASKVLGTLVPGAVTLLISIVAAMVSFRFFERPILKLKRYFPSEITKQSIVAGAS